MSQALWMRLRDVSWSEFSTSDGSGERIPRLLQDISSRKTSRAIKASHMLWKLLCKDDIHHAAAPCSTFLIDLLHQAHNDVKFEILDIIKSCISKLFNMKEKNDWQKETWNTFAKALPIFRKLHKSGSIDLKIALEPIIELLQTDSLEK